MLNGFVKVNDYQDGSFKKVELWNPATKEFKRVIVDDMEYQYGEGPFVAREYIGADRWARFDGSKEIEKAYNEWHYAECLKRGEIIEGMTIEVFKGRKYPKGTTGEVKSIYEVHDCYGRWVADYILTTDGKRIPKQNCKAIE